MGSIKDIINISNKIRLSDVNNKEDYFSNIYPEFKKKYPILFEMSCKKDIDMTLYNYITDMALKVDNKELTLEESSVEVGKSLFEKYVSPKI